MEGSCRLRLLGPVKVERDGEPVGGFESRKALALLGYLAVHDGPIPREQLVDLLWGDKPEARGRANLSWVLNRISSLLPGCLESDRHTVGLQQGSPYWLDTDAFEAQETQGDVASLTAAVELYRGEFLEGLYLQGCPEFEIWLVGERERWRQRVARVLGKLVTRHSRPGQIEQGLGFARRLLVLEPWREETHRQVMQLLAWSEQRGAALAQYETCCRTLAEELGVEPAAETTRLYQQIRDGELEIPPAPPDRLPDLSPQPPFFLLDEEEPAERPVFVARESELARLDGFLKHALAGRGQVVFVTGGAGRGKTALIQEFARRAMAAHPELVVAGGNCNAHTGIGDPYLPFREILSLLTGDIEAQRAARAVTGDQAQRLWHTLPLAAQALLEAGPDLIDVFVPGPALVRRAEAVAPWPGRADWLPRLEELVQCRAATPGDPNLQQSALFEQYTRVLRELAGQRPLLLVLDDLQWVDGGSSNLLFHLGRRIQGSQILILGAYRPSEVAQGRPSASPGQRERHPLEPVVNEFKRHYGDIEVDLARAEDRGFVEAFLDSEPNRLGGAFRETLYRQTRGHPLSTVELIRDMQERGDLVQDDEGRWVEGPALDWERLPARVEAVIAERIGRLAEPAREALRVASVEGEVFTAEVLARVLKADEREMARQLAKLDRVHCLVSAQGTRRRNGQNLSLYRFRHILFQRYLYNSLGEGERAYLHQDVGTALEALHGEGTEEIAAQLAWHFQEAGVAEKAADYLSQAGDRARNLYAFQEAIDYHKRALAFLKDGGNVERAARTLMKLGLTYHLAFKFKRAREAYEEGFSLWQRAGASLATPLPPAPHPLRLRGWDPVTLDPTISRDEWSGSLIQQLFSGLVRFNAELDVMPELARSWEMLANDERYVFHLRDDARWSDGVPVTAEDFVYAWRRVLDPALGSPEASYLYDIKGAQAYHQGRLTDVEQIGVRALDETTLQVELEGPTSYFPQLLTQPTAFPVPRHVVEAHGEAWTKMEHLVTNGPFRLESWQPGAYMVLTRDPDYRGQLTGNVDQVQLTLNVNSPAEQLALYESDRLDIVFLNPCPEANRLRRQHAAEYISGPSLYTQYVGLNANQPPFDDPRVRRAFAMAADKEKLASMTLSGYSFPATGGFVPPGMPGHSPEIGLPYDPERARRLLAESGYPDGQDFPMVEGVMAYKEQAMLDLAEDWYHTLGVEVVWKIVDWGSILARLDRDRPPLFRMAWQADYPDPDNLLRLGPPRTHWVGWASDVYVDLLEQARRITDHAERIAVYQRADRLLIQEAVILPIVYGRQHWLVKPWVRQFSPSALYWTFWSSVIIEPH